MKRFLYLWLFVTVLLALQSCTYVFFQPDKIDYSKYWSVNPDIKEIKVASFDGYEMTHWLIKAEQSNSINFKGTVFFLHGNGQNYSAYVPLIHWMTRYGYNVFMFEYRGYSKNLAEISLKNTVTDVESALGYVLSKAEYGPVSLYGQSLGGSVAGFTAANFKNKASLCSVVLEAPFSSYRKIAREKLSTSWLTWLFKYPLSWLVNNDYSPIDSIHKIAPTPLLLIHSDEDRVVPSAHGKLLFDAAKQPKSYLSVKGLHIQAMKNPETQLSIMEFLNEQGC